MARTIININGEDIELIKAVADKTINIHDLPHSTIVHRLRKGDSPGKAFSEPKQRHASTKKERQEIVRQEVSGTRPISTDLDNIPPETIYAMKNCTINEFLRTAEKYGTRINDQK